MENTSRRLLWHGMFLFLLGLGTGFFVPSITNPRMGLSAHLGGVMNGTFLLVLGLVWSRIKLEPKTLTATFWLALYGTYVNWGATLLAAIFGTSRATPVAGAGYIAKPWQEHIVNFGLYSVAVAMVLSCVFVLWGLQKNSTTTLQ